MAKRKIIHDPAECKHRWNYIPYHKKCFRCGIMMTNSGVIMSLQLSLPGFEVEPIDPIYICKDVVE